MSEARVAKLQRFRFAPLLYLRWEKKVISRFCDVIHQIRGINTDKVGHRFTLANIFFGGIQYRVTKSLAYGGHFCAGSAAFWRDLRPLAAAALP